jgi:hypothetical protein
MAASVFQSLRTLYGRAGKGDMVVWPCLKGRAFSIDQNFFLCDQIDLVPGTPLQMEPSSYDEKNLGRVTLVEVCSRYQMSVNTVKHWQKRRRAGLLLNQKGGRPAEVDAIGLATVKEEITRLEELVTQKVSGGDVQKLFLEARAATMKRKGLEVLGYVTVVRNGKKQKIPAGELILDPWTLAHYKRVDKIADREAQDLPSARIAALMDIRLTYKVACAYKGFAGQQWAENKWNADCTTLIIKPVESGRLIYVVRERGDNRRVQSAGVVVDLAVLIKIFCLGNAGGEIAKLVAIVAIKEMPKDEYFKAEIPGFTHLATRASGTVYFAHSKGGCASMWRDIFLTFIVPEIKASGDYHKHEDVNGNPMRQFLHTDGEASIMNEAFSEEVMDAFEDALVDMAKGAPMGTSKIQDLDVGHLFDSIKAGAKTVVKYNVDVSNDTLQRNVEALLFVPFKAAYKDVPISTCFKAKIHHGLKVVTYVTQKHWCSNKMKESCITTGFHRNNVPAGQETIDYERIMTRTLNTITSPEDLEQMKLMSPLVARRFVDESRVKNAYLDELDVVRSPGAKDCDGLTLCQRDCEIISHPTARAKHKATRELKEANIARIALHKTAEWIEEEAQRSAATKIVVAANKRDLAKTTALQAKQVATQQKADAKAHFDALTAEEKTEHKRVEKEKSEKAKADKREKKTTAAHKRMQDEAAARLLLA